MMQRAELAAKHHGPVLEDGFGAAAVGDAEEEVDVGPGVLGPHGAGAGERSRADPWVGLRQVQDALRHVVALLRREHVRLLAATAHLSYDESPSPERV